VLTGASGNKGTLKNEGKVVIPTHTWKVALILPRDQGLAHVRDYRDVQVLSVIMPNEPGVRNVPWQTYLTTVDAVETLSGYDLLALLEDDVENAVESGTQPPIGSIVAPASAAESDTVSFTAAGSVDPNGSVVAYTWDFGDGSSGTGVSASHTYAQDGVFTVRLTITDNDGLTDTTAHTLTVSPAAPALAQALMLIDQLVAGGKMPRAVGVALKAQVIAAQVLIGRGNRPAARVVLRAAVAEIDLLVRLRVLKAADVAGLRALLAPTL
jgi:hypothetical protein